MKMPRWALLLTLAAAGVLGLAFAAVTASGGSSKVRDRALYMTAVEWKGSAEAKKEEFPTSTLPEGGGYERIPTDASGKWNVETYRFDTAVLVAYENERITLNIFGVNAAFHDITIPDFKTNFRVSRGKLSTVKFVVRKAGIYPITCITHQPSHRADLVVLERPSS